MTALHFHKSYGVAKVKHAKIRFSNFRFILIKKCPLKGAPGAGKSTTLSTYHQIEWTTLPVPQITRYNIVYHVCVLAMVGAHKIFIIKGQRAVTGHKGVIWSHMKISIVCSSRYSFDKYRGKKSAN